MGPSWRHLAKPRGPETLILLWFLLHLRPIEDLAPIFWSVSASFSYLSRSWAILAPSWARLWPSWAVLVPIFGPCWAVLGPSWVIFGPSWGLLGAVLGLLGAILAPSFDTVGLSWAIFGRRGVMKRSAAGPFAQRNSIRPHSVRSCRGRQESASCRKLSSPKTSKTLLLTPGVVGADQSAFSAPGGLERRSRLDLVQILHFFGS